MLMGSGPQLLASYPKEPVYAIYKRFEGHTWWEAKKIEESMTPKQKEQLKICHDVGTFRSKKK